MKGHSNALAAATIATLGAGFGLCTTYGATHLLAGLLQPLCLAGLVFLCLHAARKGAETGSLSARQGLALGWLFGLAWFCSSLWWLYISMHVYGLMPSWMAATAVLALSAYLALFPAAALYAWVRLNWTALPPLRGSLGFAALWLLSEWLRSLLFTGFPWNATGYAQVDSTLGAYAALAGVDAVNGLVAFMAALAAYGIYHILYIGILKSRIILLTISIILFGVYGFSYALSKLEWSAANPAASSGLQVALIQGNVPQDLKFEAEGLRQGMQLHLKLLSEARGDLIITPETVFPLPPERLPEGMLLSLSDMLRSKESAALVGTVLRTADGGYTNGALGFKPGASSPAPSDVRAVAQYRYDKHHLVPFGEFIPFGFRWFVDLMQIPLGDFARGPVNAPSFEIKGERVAPTICYEDVFGDELRARFVADESQAPTMFANLTNLAWFGDTFALDQHLAIARMRSIEFARPSVRATNTGATVVIDHKGKVTHGFARFTQGVLNAQVQGRTGLTPYARFGSAWLLALAALFIAWGGYRQRYVSREAAK